MMFRKGLSESDDGRSQPHKDMEAEHSKQRAKVHHVLDTEEGQYGWSSMSQKNDMKWNRQT